MTVFSKCYVLYQFPVILVFCIPYFLVCLKLNLCINGALYLSPYRLSCMAVRTFEMSSFTLISRSPFLLIAPMDVVQNLEIYLVSSKYWLVMRKSWTPYHTWKHTETPTDIIRCCFVYQLACDFFICMQTHSDKAQLKSSAEEQLARLGWRKALPVFLCCQHYGVLSRLPRWVTVHRTWHNVWLCVYPERCICHISCISGCSTGAFPCPQHTTVLLS